MFTRLSKRSEPTYLDGAFLLVGLKSSLVLWCVRVQGIAPSWTPVSDTPALSKGNQDHFHWWMYQFLSRWVRYTPWHLGRGLLDEIFVSKKIRLWRQWQGISGGGGLCFGSFSSFSWLYYYTTDDFHSKGKLRQEGDAVSPKQRRARRTHNISCVPKA